jgi:hypothetical protein
VTPLVFSRASIRYSGSIYKNRNMQKSSREMSKPAGIISRPFLPKLIFKYRRFHSHVFMGFSVSYMGDHISPCWTEGFLSALAYS